MITVTGESIKDILAQLQESADMPTQATPVNPTPPAAPTNTSPAGQASFIPVATSAPVNPVPSAPMNNGVLGAQIVQNPAYNAPTTIPSSIPPAAPGVPTTPTPGYTLNEISRAGADLVDARPDLMNSLMAMMPKYGVQTLAQLRPDQFGAVATELRAMGAKI